ncbi:MAG: tRNA pseudouridine(55) synthase TruB [Microbacteriaceae bacterium]|nr:tRNA pseudouridine(55) synthase TruB [Microbacteriaceae bacterium]
MENKAPRGILLVDKPAGITSHDVVSKVRRALHTKKVGHAGTLDPAATGLLVLGVGASTKLLTWLVGQDKTYQTTIRLGWGTVSDDAESDVTDSAPEGLVDSLTEAQIRSALPEFTGKIQQVPSAVSAIKVAGKRAYDLVRAGQEVQLKSREVTVSRFEISAIERGVDAGRDFIDLTAEVDCSSGTYIRALARDLGGALGAYGHLTALRRTRIGAWQVSDALQIEQLSESISLISDADVAKSLMPSFQASDAQATDIFHGRQTKIDSHDMDLIAAISPTNQLLSIGSSVAGRFIPSIVFPT